MQIDRARAADLGIRTEDIAAALRLMVGGDQEVSRFRDPLVGEDYDVQLRLVEADRRDPETIARLYVARNTGEMVRLDSVVRLEEGQKPVPRRPLRSPAPGQPSLRHPAGLRARRIASRRSGLPPRSWACLPAYTTAVSGRGRELERTIRVRLGVPAVGRRSCTWCWRPRTRAC